MANKRERGRRQRGGREKTRETDGGRQSPHIGNMRSWAARQQRGECASVDDSNRGRGGATSIKLVARTKTPNKHLAWGATLVLWLVSCPRLCLPCRPPPCDSSTSHPLPPGPPGQEAHGSAETEMEANTADTTAAGHGAGAAGGRSSTFGGASWFPGHPARLEDAQMSSTRALQRERESEAPPGPRPAAAAAAATAPTRPLTAGLRVPKRAGGAGGAHWR